MRITRASHGSKLISFLLAILAVSFLVPPASAQGPTIENPAPDASRPDGIYTPFTNREIYQLIPSDYQEIVALTNEALQGRPIPSADILRVYEESQHARVGTQSRLLRGFARDEARATEFPEAAAFFGSPTFLDDSVMEAILGIGSASAYTPLQRRQAIQKSVQRVVYAWAMHYVLEAGTSLNPGLVDEAWAIYMGKDVDGAYPNSISAVAVSREQNFNRPGSIDVPLRQALSRAQRAAADKDAAAYQAAAQEITSRMNAIYYLSTARYLNESLKAAQEGNLDAAGASQVEGLSYYRFIQPTVARTNPAADAALVAYFTGAPSALTAAGRDETLAALNTAVDSLLLASSDRVAPENFA
jgi:hypothetical protein